MVSRKIWFPVNFKKQSHNPQQQNFDLVSWLHSVEPVLNTNVLVALQFLMKPLTTWGVKVKKVAVVLLADKLWQNHWKSYLKALWKFELTYWDSRHRGPSLWMRKRYKTNNKICTHHCSRCIQCAHNNRWTKIGPIWQCNARGCSTTNKWLSRHAQI